MSVSGRSLPPSPATYIFAQNHVPYVTVWAKPSMSLYSEVDSQVLSAAQVRLDYTDPVSGHHLESMIYEK
jgi:hypothetical protein